MENNDISNCYGTLECKKREKCPWGSACLSRAREPIEDRHFQIQHISVPCMIYDPNNTGHDEDTQSAIEAYFSAEEKTETPYSLELDGLTITEDSLPVVMTVVERIAGFYFDKPKTFDALMKMVFLGKNQSDLARDENVSRQCINKRMLKELGIAQKRNDVQQRRDRELAEKKQELDEQLEKLRQQDAVLKTLSPRQWSVYVKVFVDGCSIGSAAKQLNLHKTQVARCVQFLRSKLN
jgi:hypothetical protein